MDEPHDNPRLGRRRRAKLALGRAAPLVSALLVLGGAWLARGYTADDAFIAGRYAARLASGLGYTFRAGAPTDGVTGPLLLAIEVPAAALGVDPVLASKLVGAALVALAALLVTRRAAARANGALTSALVPFGFLASGALLMHAQSGLETGLATSLVTIAGLAATSNDARVWPRRAALALSALAMPWLRPELVPLTWALGALWVRRAPAASRASEARTALASALVGLSSVFAFRLILFGDPLPLSLHAKPSDLSVGARYVITSLAVLFGLSIVFALEAARRSRSDARLFAALTVAPLAVLVAGGDWMPGGRLLVPIMPLTWLLSARGLARFVVTRAHRSLWLALAALALAPQLASSAFMLAQADDVARSERGPGTELRELLDREARVVALIDAGYLAYGARFDPIDLAGVTFPAFGRREGGHCAKPITVDDLLAYDVDALVLHSLVVPRVEDGVVVSLAGHPTERALVADPRLARLFEVRAIVRYAPDYHYVVWRRRPEAASAGGRRPVSATRGSSSTGAPSR